MQRPLRLVAGGIGLLLVALVLGSLSRPALLDRAATPERSHDRSALVADDEREPVVARTATTAERVERARPAVLAVLTVALVLLALRWAGSVASRPALVPVRVDGRRSAPVRAPPRAGSPRR